MQVPLLVRWPGRTSVETRTELVDLTDLLPTLAELVGEPIPPGDGISLGGYIDPALPTPETRPWVFAQYERNFAMRDQRWKLLSTGEIIDLQNDPQEQSPLTSDNDTVDSAAARTFLMAESEGLLTSPDPS